MPVCLNCLEGLVSAKVTISYYPSIHTVSFKLWMLICRKLEGIHCCIGSHPGNPMSIRQLFVRKWHWSLLSIHHIFYFRILETQLPKVGNGTLAILNCHNQMMIFWSCCGSILRNNWTDFANVSYDNGCIFEGARCPAQNQHCPFKVEIRFAPLDLPRLLLLLQQTMMSQNLNWWSMNSMQTCNSFTFSPWKYSFSVDSRKCILPNMIGAEPPW